MDIIHLLFGIPVLFLNKCYTMGSVLHLKKQTHRTQACESVHTTRMTLLAKNKIKYNSHRHININTKRVASGTELFIPNFRASILKLYTFRGCWVRSNARFVISEYVIHYGAENLFTFRHMYCTLYNTVYIYILYYILCIMDKQHKH